MIRHLYLLKRTVFSIALLACCCAVVLPCRAGSIGSWKAYLSYHNITEIEKGGDVLYVLASNNLFAYNTVDNSIQTFSKMDVLNDCSIKHIAWNNKVKKLLIAYQNNNIDLLEANGNTMNMSEYYHKATIADKTINSIYIYDQYAYLATGLGVVKVNMNKAEFSDTYQLNVNVTQVAISGNTIYAKTSNGVYQAQMNNNLIDTKNWSLTTSYPANIFNKDTSVWDQYIGQLRTLSTDGPRYNNFGFLKYANDRLYTTSGGFEFGMERQNMGVVQVLDNDQWIIYQDSLESITGVHFEDMTTLDIDPTDPTRVFSAGKTGLYEFKNGVFTNYWGLKNSPYGSAIPDNNPNYVLVQSILFDKEGNLWTVHSQSKKAPIIVLRKDGTWKEIYSDELMMDDERTMGYLQNLMFDSRGLLWFCNNHWINTALIWYNINTEKLHTFTYFINEDGTRVEVNTVQCVAEDLEGNIWIGTNVGPLMLKAEDINEDNPEFIQVKVPRNDGTNYADYLLSGVDISGIAVDGGNRKWFITKENGVYLMGADNITQIHHFTAENSPLLSNTLQSIAINDKTGEVFFGTDRGLCSFMSDASAVAEEMTKDNVYAYPNPVRPDYTGLITVTGLTYNADVKIVTANGTLVAEGRSNGGTFTWDGCDQRNGKRVASGVYMVQTATADGEKGTVCKIAIVR